MLNFLIKYRTKKALKENKPEKVYLNWREIKRILVLFDTVNYEDADAFVEYMEKQGKEVKVCAFKGKKDTCDYSETNYTMITQNEIKDWTGEAIMEAIAPLVAEKYDLIIDLSLDRLPVLELVSAKATASLKVGYKKTKLPLYDLTISSLPKSEKEENPRPIRELARQIVFYLSQISSSD